MVEINREALQDIENDEQSSKFNYFIEQTAADVEIKCFLFFLIDLVVLKRTVSSV
jgi:hypothetical protein